MVGNGLEKGITLSFPRQDLLTKPREVLLKGLDESQQTMTLFSRKLAEDLNIAGVAVSGIKYGGTYIHFFVKELEREEVTRRTLDTIRGAFPLLSSVAQDRAGYFSFICLGAQTFDDEVEEAFRKRWNTGDPDAEELDLLQIVKFV